MEKHKNNIGNVNNKEFRKKISPARLHTKYPLGIQTDYLSRDKHYFED